MTCKRFAKIEFYHKKIQKGTKTTKRIRAKFHSFYHKKIQKGTKTKSVRSLTGN